MKLFDRGHDCCGCTACAQICPRGAIAMQADGEGFAYPIVDDERCVGCGLCQKVCAFQGDRRAGCPPAESSADGPLTILAVKHRNVAIRCQSQSGGLFTLLSDPVLARGGAIYGAGFRPDFSVCHQRAQTREVRDALRGSKYVQSEMGDTFRAVRQDLADGREVLFSGTPCQIAGLRAYLALQEVDRSRLVLCDLVCHGTPSPMVWRDYLAWCERQSGQRIAKVCFRDSLRFGWHSHIETIIFQNGEIHSDEIFATLFYQHLVLRPSCHVCPYVSPRRCSDVTMGDFWGIERTHPEFADNIGVSLAIVHTEKGKQAMAEVSGKMDVVQSDLAACWQPNLCAPTKIPSDRSRFWKNYQTKKENIFKSYSFEVQKKRYRHSLRRLVRDLMR